MIYEYDIAYKTLEGKYNRKSVESKTSYSTKDVFEAFKEVLEKEFGLGKIIAISKTIK